MSVSPLVSVCIPVYNGEQYLEEAIESVLRQTYDNIQIVVVDDSSTDDSGAILERFSNRDSRVEYYKNIRNMGLVGNWNECIKHATGDWIKFVFQDDYISPTCIERLVECTVSTNPPLKAAFCRRQFIYEYVSSSPSASSDSKLTKKYESTKFLWDIFSGKALYTTRDIVDIVVRWPGRNKFGEPTSFLIERELFEDLGSFDDEFVHICDLEYWLRIGANYRIGFVNETLAFFRVHGASTTIFNRSENWYQTRYLDRLRLFSRFMNSPYYRNIRASFPHCFHSNYLEIQAAIFLRKARLEALSSSNGDWMKEYRKHEQSWGEIAPLSREWLPILALRYYSARISFTLAKWLDSMSAIFQKRARN